MAWRCHAVTVLSASRVSGSGFSVIGVGGRQGSRRRFFFWDV